MVYLNPVAFLDANKGLTICFIIAIIITNVTLIYMKFQTGRVFYIPSNLTITSLAIGDIFLALFALVVQARIFFETLELQLDCSTYKAYLTYTNFLMHFVYGLGLVVLAGEILQRHRFHPPTGNSLNNIAKSVAYSACPWILGLIIILPLTMADAYVESPGSISECRMLVTKSRFNAMYVVSVILPAILAVFACFAAEIVKFPPTYYSSSPSAVTYGPTQGVVITTQNTNVGHATGPPAAPYYPNANIQGPQQYAGNGQPRASQMPLASTNDKPGPNHGGQVFSTPSAQYPVQQYPVQQYSAQQYPAQQYPVQYPSPQFPVQQYTPQPNVIFTAPASTVYQQNTTAAPNPDKEKKALVVVSIIYFLCVVPIAAYKIGTFTYSYKIDNENTIINTSLFWLSIARSVITPIIFILVK